MRAISIIMIVPIVFLVLFDQPSLALLLFIISALLYIWGSRKAREEREQRRHDELLAAVREGKDLR